MAKKTEIEYTLKTNLPYAGKGETRTAKEWKRVFGYEVAAPPAGIRFVSKEETLNTVEVSKSPAESIAAIISNALNTTTFSAEGVAMELAKDHRYLQQEFWKLIESLIKIHASRFDEKKFDGRNEYTVKMCAKIAPLLDKFREEIANNK